jgi:threonyl-tRNA synthetase
MLIIGDRDIENGTVSPRDRVKGDLGAMSKDAFIELLTQTVEEKR